MMSTSLDHWGEKIGWSDECLGWGLAYNRYFMNVSSLRDYPKHAVWTLLLSCLLLPFAPNLSIPFMLNPKEPLGPGWMYFLI